MKLHKAIKKIAAIGIGTTMLGATMFGAMAADLSKYPSPFITDGKFDGILVVGTGGTDPAGLASDILGVTDIAIGLQTSATTAASGGGTVTTIAGDSWKVGTSNKHLEMGEQTGASTINGENFNNQTSFIDGSDLDALASGELQNNQGTAGYNQYLHFDEKFDGTTTDSTGYVLYTEDDDDKTADFLFFKSNKQIARYELEFTTSFESDVEDSAGTTTSTGTYLTDFEDEEITLLGKTYTIVKARRSKAGDPTGSVKLTMFGGSEKIIMEEGETRTITVGDKEYEVTIDAITDTGTIKAKFTVNGESTKSIVDGDSDKLSDGTEVGVTDIIQNEAGDVTNDLVEFYIGAQKIVIENTNVANGSNSTKTLEVGEESIDGTSVIIKGSDDDSKFKIDNIQINMTADDDYYVSNGETLSEEIVGQGDEKPVLFTNNWDIKYLGLDDIEAEKITIKTSGKTKYQLGFQDWGGNDVKVTIAYTPGGALVQMGSDDDDFIKEELKKITKNDYFVVTDTSKEAGKRPTYLMRYKGADKNTADTPKIKLENVGTGENLEKTYTGTTPTDVTFNIGGAQYKVRGYDTASNDFDVSVDLNGDGTYNNSNVTINTRAGAQIALNNATSGLTNGTDVQLNITTPDNDDYEDLNPSSLDVRITAASGEVDLTETGPMVFRTPEDEDNVNYAYNTMGAFVKWTSPTSDPDEFEVDYPKQQRLPQVYVTSGSTETKTVGGAGTENVNINPIEGGFAKLDRDVSSAMLQSNNVLSIGGPCVNSATAEIMGLSPGTCGAASGVPENKALLKTFENGDKVALVVAGWTAEDTQRATRVLRYYDKYAADLKGTEVEVSGTTLSDISVGKPSVVATPAVVEGAEAEAEAEAEGENTTQ